jgi:hypothetical protein
MRSAITSLIAPTRGAIDQRLLWPQSTLDDTHVVVDVPNLVAPCHPMVLRGLAVH